MPHQSSFIYPRNQDEEKQTEQVAQLVYSHFQNLLRSAPKTTQKELAKLVIRTIWDSVSGDMYGEYFGVPAPKQGVYDTGMMPSEIVIFARPLLQYSPHPDGLSNKVRLTLVHEIGHYLGLSEEELRRRNIY